MPTAFDQADLDKTVQQIRAKLAAEEDTRSALTKALDAINTLARGIVGKKPLRKADGDPGTGDSDKPWDDEQDVSEDPDPTDEIVKTAKKTMTKADGVNDSGGEGESDANGGDTTTSQQTDIEEPWDKLDKADDDAPPWLDEDDEDTEREEMEKARARKARRRTIRLGKANGSETHIHLHQHGSDDGNDDDDDMAAMGSNGNGDAGWDDDDGEMNGDSGMSEQEDRSDDDDMADAILQVLQDHIDRHDGDDNGGDDFMDKSGKSAQGFAKATGPRGSAVAVNKFLTKSLQMQDHQEKRLQALEKAQAWTMRELKKSRSERGKQTDALTAIGQAMLKMGEGQEAITKSLTTLMEDREQQASAPHDSRYERIQKSQLGNGLRQSSTYDKRKAADLLMKGTITMQDHAQWKYRGVVPQALSNAS